MRVMYAEFGGLHLHFLVVMLPVAATICIFTINHIFMLDRLGHLLYLNKNFLAPPLWTPPSLSNLIEGFHPSNFIWALLFAFHVPLRILIIITTTEYLYIGASKPGVGGGWIRAVLDKHILFKIRVQRAFAYLELITVSGVALLPQPFLPNFLIFNKNIHAFCGELFGFSALTFAILSVTTQHVLLDQQFIGKKYVKMLNCTRIILTGLLAIFTVTTAVSVFHLRLAGVTIGFYMFPVSEYMFLFLTISNHALLALPIFCQFRVILRKNLRMDFTKKKLHEQKRLLH